MSPVFFLGAPKYPTVVFHTFVLFTI